MPPGIVGIAYPQVLALLGASVTLAKWSGQRKSWNKWCQMVDAGVFPSSKEELLNITLLYLVQLRERGVLAVVVQRRIVGVRFHLLLRGLVDVSGSFVVRQALKGWWKEFIRRECQRPITHLLLQLSSVEAVCSSPFETYFIRASFVLAFFGALRVGELVAPSHSRLGGLLLPYVGAIIDAVRLCIRRSKTDTFDRGEWVSIRKVYRGVCPVSIVLGYLSHRKSGAAFLAHEDGSNCVYRCWGESERFWHSFV